MVNSKSRARHDTRRSASMIREFPATEKVTVLMEAVLANRVKGVAALLAREHIVWNQRGPCGRKPEEAALELGFDEIHRMLVAVRERAELRAGIGQASVGGSLRL